MLTIIYIFQDEKVIADSTNNSTSNCPELKSEMSEPPVTIVLNVTGSSSSGTIMPHRVWNLLLFRCIYIWKHVVSVDTYIWKSVFTYFFVFVSEPSLICVTG